MLELGVYHLVLEGAWAHRVRSSVFSARCHLVECILETVGVRSVTKEAWLRKGIRILKLILSSKSAAKAVHMRAIGVAEALIVHKRTLKLLLLHELGVKLRLLWLIH